MSSTYSAAAAAAVAAVVENGSSSARPVVPSSVVSQPSLSSGVRKAEPPQIYANHSTPTYAGGAHNGSSSNGPSGGSVVKPPFKIKLAEHALWKQFGQIGTEMIITKSGR